jgi:hypothetical protein
LAHGGLGDLHLTLRGADIALPGLHLAKFGVQVEREPGTGTEPRIGLCHLPARGLLRKDRKLLAHGLGVRHKLGQD